MKIWAKIIINHKILKDIVMDVSMAFNLDNYDAILRDVSYILDIPTPLAIKIHYEYLDKFHSHKFKPDDFVEHVYFDILELECIPEDDD